MPDKNTTEKTNTRRQQQRSIETRNKILAVGMDLLLKKGFHRITTDDIAKAAGLSTGIIYHYFKDKKDILISALEIHADNIFSDVLNVYQTNILELGGNFEDFLRLVFNYFLEYHKKNWEVHEEMESLYHSDPDIAYCMDKFWIKAFDMLAEILISKGFSEIHIRDNIRMILNFIECYCHTYMRPVNENLDQDYMLDKTIKIIMELLYQAPNA